MASNTSTPGDDPSHSTYEVNVPVRNGRGAEPQASNPEIRIPGIKPVTREEEQSQKSPQELAAGLEGKYVDEFGNILDWDGTVLGRVEGDLPSMVGRPVSASGEILDADGGEVAGRVCENYIKPKLEPLSSGLRVDSEGNIYDEEGNVVGKLNNKPKNGDDKDKGKDKDGSNQTQGGSSSNNPKPAVAPRPDELYLDVKSTFDGIQLIIKIPTVFNRDRVSEGSQNQNQQDENQGQSNNQNR